METLVSYLLPCEVADSWGCSSTHAAFVRAQGADDVISRVATRFGACLCSNRMAGYTCNNYQGPQGGTGMYRNITFYPEGISSGKEGELCFLLLSPMGPYHLSFA
eukprot:jgi/Botrbrau1/10094/Bobra.20_2s0002.1